MRAIYLQLSLATLIAITTAQNASSIHSESDLLIRKARWLPLLYPLMHPAKVQFIAGIGIPVQDLNIETITVGYVFKAQYFLPLRPVDLRNKTTQPITARRTMQDNATIFQQLVGKTDQELGLSVSPLNDFKHTLSGYRWAAYKGFEGLATRMQLNGRECVLKSICESATMPFDEQNGLLGELLHILLTPSSSMDQLSLHTDNDYLHAEHLGRVGGDCEKVYAHCPRSLLEHFSEAHDLGSDLLNMFS